MPDHLDEKEKAIFRKLADSLRPTALEVKDVSGGCGSMYAVSITSEKFRGLAVIKQHRLVNEILGEDIKSWHGIQLRTKAP
ncbi:BolA-like protein 3 [Venturia effusa]|uniref:BolA-like protein 3 n=1 Tax=Venturia effusa TaxID=50376 RepID=A0A517LGM5_9PEZI|nr:BolA-like protein 3 [Venturia effusa]